ncbi:hypothetical protein OAH91_00375 [Emcibacteraceae bacterium]|nr:hypothetical protein [Emcibacteraceae bacterium]
MVAETQKGRKMVRNVCIIGLGWSGSGALVDYMKLTTDFKAFNKEFDFLRKQPVFDSVFMQEATQPNYFGNIIFCLKAVVRNIFWPKLFLPSLLHLKFVIGLIRRIKFHDDKNKAIEDYFKSQKVIFDQAFFVEQFVIEPELLNLFDHVFIVSRNPTSQFNDIYNHYDLIKPSTILEIFRSGYFHKKTRSVHVQNILDVMEFRLKACHNIKDLQKNNVSFVKFEDLVSNPVSFHNQNKGLLSGCQNEKQTLLMLNSFFENSKKNIKNTSEYKFSQHDLDTLKGLAIVESDLYKD